MLSPTGELAEAVPCPGTGPWQDLDRAATCSFSVALPLSREFSSTRRAFSFWAALSCSSCKTRGEVQGGSQRPPPPLPPHAHGALPAPSWDLPQPAKGSPTEQKGKHAFGPGEKELALWGSPPPDGPERPEELAF